MNKVVLVTGGFDPLHSGHIAYFSAAKELGDALWVGLNSDAWLARKKGRSFMPIQERASVVNALGCVDQVITGFKDDDDSACDAIRWALELGAERIIFANGGDRKTINCPEYERYRDDTRVSFAWGVGGTDKKNSSSWILKDWRAPKTERSWGHYRELYSGDGFAVKELVINPHSSLSMQRHQHRSETWNIVSGEAHVKISNRSTPEDCLRIDLSVPNPVDIPSGVWHQCVNTSDEPAHIVEIWKGPSEHLNEDDIERFE
jgi:cytidyltransferase-like protein